MPAILGPDAWEGWLHGGANDLAQQTSVLRPAAGDLLHAYPVSTLVNNPANDSSRCVEAIALGQGEDDGIDGLNEPPQDGLF